MTASTRFDVALIVGSNRRESINRRLAEATLRLAPADLVFRSVQIDDMPIYNGDLEAQRPASVQRFTAEVSRAQALFIVTPEHNRSITAVLKNAIDWGSKPMDANVWRDKPVAVTGTSPGAIGTAVAQTHLREVMSILGAQVMGGEAYIQFKPELIDANGDIAVDSTREFLRRYVENFARLVRRWHSGA